MVLNVFACETGVKVINDGKIILTPIYITQEGQLSRISIKKQNVGQEFQLGSEGNILVKILEVGDEQGIVYTIFKINSPDYYDHVVRVSFDYEQKIGYKVPFQEDSSIQIDEEIGCFSNR